MTPQNQAAVTKIADGFFQQGESSVFLTRCCGRVLVGLQAATRCSTCSTPPVSYPVSCPNGVVKVLAGWAALTGLLVVLFGGTARAAEPVKVPEAAIEVWFSPKGGCTAALVKALRTAKKSIYVQAYSFTSGPIAQALAAQANAGIPVKVLLDKSNLDECGARPRTAVSILKGSRVGYSADNAHAIAHNKIMILDEKVVFTGSFNFSGAAETSNAENLIKIDSPALAARYLENWKIHQLHSDLCQAAREGAEPPAGSGPTKP